MHDPRSFISQIAERIAATCAYTYLLCAMGRLDVRYHVAKDTATFARIGCLRRQVYRTARSSYLIKELDENGFDAFDQNATSFVAEPRSAPGNVFATVRAVHYPFEILQFVSEEFLGRSLESRNHVRTVEVSRLVSSRPNKALTNGLLLFGGVYLALHGITRYFAYIALPEGATRPKQGDFTIPNRNAAGYTIVSGSIPKHAARIGPRLWRKTKSPAPAIAAPRSEGRAA
jgi:hypothetical protein